MTTFKVEKKLGLVLVAAALITSTVGCAKPAPHVGEAVTQSTNAAGVVVTKTETRELQDNGKISGTNSELRQVTADVVAVDAVSRLITLRSADKTTTTFKVSEKVRNLPQVRAGDRVSLNYFESLTFEVRTPTAEELKTSKTGVVARNPVGSKPGALAGIGTKGVLTITDIDKTKQQVSFRGPNGTGTVTVKYPENLNYVQKGDTVVITASELLVADVRPAT